MTMYYSFVGSFDFYATNHYSSQLCSPGDKTATSTNHDDMNVKREFNPSWPTSASTWLRVSYTFIVTSKRIDILKQCQI